MCSSKNRANLNIGAVNTDFGKFSRDFPKTRRFSSIFTGNVRFLAILPHVSPVSNMSYNDRFVIVFCDNFVIVKNSVLKLRGQFIEPLADVQLIAIKRKKRLNAVPRERLVIRSMARDRPSPYRTARRFFGCIVLGPLGPKRVV